VGRRDWVSSLVEKYYGAVKSTTKFGAVIMLLLGLVKAVAGMLAGSIALTADGVNTLAYVFVMVSAWAQLKVKTCSIEKERRSAFLGFHDVTSSVVAAIIFLAGAELMGEFIIKWNSPQALSLPSLALITSLGAGASMLLVWAYFKRMGEEQDVDALRAEAKNLLVSSQFSFLVAASIGMYYFGHDLPELLVGLFITLHLLKAGVILLRDSAISFLGGKSEEKVRLSVLKALAGEKGVAGIRGIEVRRFGEFFFAEVTISGKRMSKKKKGELRLRLTKLVSEKCRVDCAVVEVT